MISTFDRYGGYLLPYGHMGTVTTIRGKTEQRVGQVISILKDAKAPLSYEDIRLASGARSRGKKGVLYGGVAYDQLLYILSTLIEVGLVERSEDSERGPGRPRVFFHWRNNAKAARAMGARLSA